MLLLYLCTHAEGLGIFLDYKLDTDASQQSSLNTTYQTFSRCLFITCKATKLADFFADEKLYRDSTNTVSEEWIKGKRIADTPITNCLRDPKQEREGGLYNFKQKH